MLVIPNNVGAWSMNSSYREGLTWWYPDMHTTSHSQSNSLSSPSSKTGFKLVIKGGLILYMDGSQTNKGNGVWVYCWGSRRGQSFSPGLHAEIYAIKAGIMENTEKDYTGRNIQILSNSWATIKVLDSFQVNSKLVWDCHQSLVKMKEHKGSNMVPGHMGMDWNEIADQLARQMIWDWISRTHEEYWQSIHGQRQAKGFQKRSSAKRATESLKLSINQPRMMIGLLTGMSFKRTFI